MHVTIKIKVSNGFVRKVVRMVKYAAVGWYKCQEYTGELLMSPPDLTQPRSLHSIMILSLELGFLKGRVTCKKKFF